MDFGGTYEYSDNPNEELEWRNQAGAHTDCYVKYRVSLWHLLESAEFIIISDIDDVLIPRHHKNYLDEFHELNVQYPWASALRYYRFNTAFQTEKEASGYSINEAVRTARLAMNQREDGKSVVKTKVVETVWIHWPALTKGWHTYYDIDSEFNFMVHFRNWTASSEAKHINRKSKVYKKSRPLHNFFAADKFRLLQMRAENFVAKNAQFEFDALPSDSVYYKLIENCYNDMFYSRGRVVTTCPSPARCNFPGNLEGVECAVAGGRVKHTFINDNLIVHHISKATKGMEIHSEGCKYL
uniref:Glycosyltransferase family 92 protein n=1 Tax=Panagrellus redivivus TaxID=6233 RepID=A0A7E4UPW6_PANRE